jgi:hypothetical protein
MRMLVKKENPSGIIRLQGAIIFWNYGNKDLVEINTNDILVIGEYTNPDGPYFDDWFLIFVTQNGQWHSIPWYADNMNLLTQYLSNKFNQDFNTTHLAASTEWKSIVRYPIHLTGRALFTLTRSAILEKQKTFLDKIFSSVGIGNFHTASNIALTEEIKKELKRWTG